MKLFFAFLGALLSGVVVAPRAARAADPVPLRVVTTDPGLEVFDQTDQVVMVPVRVGRYGTALQRSHVFKPLCEAPCEVQLQPGAHVLALSKHGGALVEGEEVIHLDGPATVTASYADRSAWRGVGLALGLASAGIGAGLLVASVHTTTVCTPSTISGYVPNLGTIGNPGSCAQVEQTNGGMVGAGAGALIAGLVAGLIMGLQPDEASFTITPLTLSSLSPQHEGALAALPNGLGLSMRF